MLYMCFVKGFVIFPEVQYMYFVMCVVTCASLQSGALANSVFRDLVISLSWSCLSHDAICFCCFLVIRVSFDDDQ